LIFSQTLQKVIFFSNPCDIYHFEIFQALELYMLYAQQIIHKFEMNWRNMWKFDELILSQTWISLKSSQENDRFPEKKEGSE